MALIFLTVPMMLLCREADTDVKGISLVYE